MQIFALMWVLNKKIYTFEITFQRFFCITCLVLLAIFNYSLILKFSLPPTGSITQRSYLASVALLTKQYINSSTDKCSDATWYRNCTSKANVTFG